MKLLKIQNIIPYWLFGTIIVYVIQFVIHTRDIVNVFRTIGLEPLDLSSLGSLLLLITIVLIVIAIVLSLNEDERNTAKVTRAMRNYFRSDLDSIDVDMTDIEKSELTRANKIKKEKNDLIDSIAVFFHDKTVMFKVSIRNIHDEKLFAEIEKPVYEYFKRCLNEIGDYSIGELEYKKYYRIIMATKKKKAS